MIYFIMYYIVVVLHFFFLKQKTPYELRISDWSSDVCSSDLSDPKGNVVLDSPETVAALEYSKQLYDTFLPGTLSWQDPSNNKVFFDGQIGLTNNGISVYYAAKLSKDPTIHAMATDIHHAHYPVGPVGKPTALPGIPPMMAFKRPERRRVGKERVQTCR